MKCSLPSVALVLFLSSSIAWALTCNRSANNHQGPPDQDIVHWLGVTEVASGPGVRGRWEQNESTYRFVDDPSVAFAEESSLAVAWVDQAEKDVLFQLLSTRGGRPTSSPINLSRSPDIFSWLPRVAVAPDSPETIYVLWQEIIFSGGSHGGDILFARSQDGGASFSDPRNLSQSIGGAGKGRIHAEFWENGSLDLAVGAGGAVYAAWTQYDGSLWLCRSSDYGQSFRPKARLHPDDGPARAPSLALGPDQHVYLAWTIGEDSGADIRLTRSTDGGENFSVPTKVASSETYSDVPKLAVSPDGTLHLAYSEGEAGPFSRFVINYTRSTDDGFSFTAPLTISRPLPDGIESARYSDIGTDADGNIYVLWELFPDARARPRGLAMAISNDGGDSFHPAMAVPESRDPLGGVNGSQQGLLMGKLAVSGDGKIVVANSSFLRGKRSRVWLIRGERGF